MTDKSVTFNDLLENTELAEDAKTALQEVWEAKLTEARDQLTAELREEFAQRYAHDKSQIVEAVDTFIESQISEHVAEMAEEKKALAEERVKAKRAIAEHTKLLDRFVTETVAKEVKELRADKERHAHHLDKLDEFVTEQLTIELSEFHEDKKALVEQKVKMLREGKKQLLETKKNFIRKAAETVEETVNKIVTEEVKAFRKDINSARENDFGRKIFEAFAAEFRGSHMNDAKEIKDLQKTLARTAKSLKIAESKITNQQDQVTLTESKLRVAEDRYARKEKLDQLLKPLGQEKREVMSDLLESVKTEKLDSAFDKYLPSVISEDAPRKKTKTIIKEHTGNKAPAKAEAIEDTNVVEFHDELRKMAGITKD